MRKTYILLTITALLLLTVVLLFVIGAKKETASTEEVKETTSADITRAPLASEALRTKANVIYEYDSENKKILNIVIEVLNPATNRLSFFAMPGESRYFMSQSVYRELSLELVTLPQMITFSELYTYYGKKEAFAAGAKVVGDMCGVTDVYYTVMDSDKFCEIFSIEENYYGMKLSLALTNEDVRSGGVGSVKEYMERELRLLKTNWSLEERLVYLELYDGLSESDVLCFEVPGVRGSSGYEVDADKLRGQMAQLANERYN